MCLKKPSVSLVPGASGPGCRRQGWLAAHLPRWTSIAALLSLAGCSGLQEAGTTAADMALGVVGLQRAGNGNAQNPAKTVSLRLEAANDLNAGDDGKGLSAIVRLYKLRDRNAFGSAPYASFGSAEDERRAFGSDLLEVRELVLAPGRTLELQEKLPPDAQYLGVVTLYRAPHGQRWRFTYAVADVPKSFITVGLHACAMTSPSIAPLGLTVTQATLLSPVKCSRTVNPMLSYLEAK